MLNGRGRGPENVAQGWFQEPGPSWNQPCDGMCKKAVFTEEGMRRCGEPVERESLCAFHLKQMKEAAGAAH